MSFLIAIPQSLSGASDDLATIGAAITAANGAAAAPTTGLLAASADEVSVALAGLFGTHAQAYQILAARAEGFHHRLVSLLGGSANSYAAAEAASASPLQAFEQDVLAVINAPTQALLGRPLIGDGATGTAAHPNGYNGGLLYGNGGAGYSETANAGWPAAAGGAPGYVYVTNAGSGSVSVIGTTNQVISTVIVGNDPEGVAVSPTGPEAGFVYVANRGSGSVSVLS
jgi:YVTN family beta-propeller protein